MDTSGDSVGAVLRTLARVVPQHATSKPRNLTSTSAVWIGTRPDWSTDPPGPMVFPATGAVHRLAVTDQLHLHERLLRVGWGLFCTGAEAARLRTPLVSWPVRLTERGATAEEAWAGPFGALVIGMEPAGDLELTPLVRDRELAEQLADRAVFHDISQLGSTTSKIRQLEGWIHEVTTAAGLGKPTVVGAEHDWLADDSARPVVAAGLVIYQASQDEPINMRNSMLEWSARPDLDDTALARLYLPHVGEPSTARGPEVEASSLPLSNAQREVVRASRTRPLTAVSGPPGCGKTHALAALALDAVSRGDTVLMATRSRYAAEVIAEMLRRSAGPVPVLFGDTELRHKIAEELAEGLPDPEKTDVDTRRRGLAHAVARRQCVESAVEQALAEEVAATRARSASELTMTHQVSAPRLFDGTTDVDVVGRQLAAARRPRRGPFSGWQSRRAARRLRMLVGAEASTTLDDVTAALGVASDLGAAARLQSAGGNAMAELRGAHAAAEANVYAAATKLGTATTSGARARSPSSRRAVAQLAAALRAGRATRREYLGRIADDDVTAALPLWVGTLGDVEDLLPPVPGLFDLVVVDEASHVDQPSAVPALLRGRRAVIAGDPRQLRHVSFVGMEEMTEALHAEDTWSLRAKLDVPGMSLFDVAAATAPVNWLQEHYRCAPHVIGFAARHFYPNRLVLLTTHPAIADRDCITVARVAGQRDDSGFNELEVAAAMDIVKQLIGAGARSIGVLSPLRAQAEALERALLKELTYQQAREAEIRTGTVHSFQGSECDELVVSLALSETDSAGAWSFVNDPHLMAVLTTRARRAVHIVTSVTTADGLIGDYLRHADHPPGALTGAPAQDTWTAELAHELRRAGLTVRTGYPLGNSLLDLVVGGGQDAIAVETRPHPDGADAHLDRWRMLAATGWRTHDAYPSRFGHDVARAAVQLGGELTPQESNSPGSRPSLR